jgi:predicted lipoprotein with Yx(FWY)xxD motif
MRRLQVPNSPLLPFRRLLLASALATMLIALVAAPAGARTSKLVAKQVQSATLGKTVLANLKGHTLYSLSAETNGRFICTGTCLADWHPLLVPAGTKPTGPVKLGTIKRPEGKTQVTFKGKPLYAFAGDSKPGQANGEGFKDVGTWHAATLAASPMPPTEPQPQPEPGNPYPY